MRLFFTTNEASAGQHTTKFVGFLESGLNRFCRFNHADGDLEDTDFVDNSEFLICTHDTGNSSVRLLRLRKEFPVSHVIT